MEILGVKITRYIFRNTYQDKLQQGEFAQRIENYEKGYFRFLK